MAINSSELNTAPTTFITVRKSKKDKFKDLFFQKCKPNSTTSESVSSVHDQHLGENNNSTDTTEKSESNISEKVQSNQEIVSSYRTLSMNSENTYTQSSVTNFSQTLKKNRMKNIFRKVWGNTTTQNLITNLSFLKDNDVKEDKSSTEYCNNATEYSTELSSRYSDLATSSEQLIHTTFRSNSKTPTSAKPSNYRITKVSKLYRNTIPSTTILDENYPSENHRFEDKIYSYTTESIINVSSINNINFTTNVYKHNYLGHYYKINGTDIFVPTKKSFFQNVWQNRNTTSNYTIQTPKESVDSTIIQSVKGLIKSNESTIKCSSQRNFHLKDLLNFQKHPHRNSSRKHVHRENCARTIHLFKTKFSWAASKTEKMTLQPISSTRNITETTDIFVNSTLPIATGCVESDFLLSGKIREGLFNDSGNESTYNEIAKDNNVLNMINLDMTEITNLSMYQYNNTDIKSSTCFHNTHTNSPKPANENNSNPFDLNSDATTTVNNSLCFNEIIHDSTNSKSNKFYFKNIFKSKKYSTCNNLNLAQPNFKTDEVENSTTEMYVTETMNLIESQIPSTPHVEFSSTGSDQSLDITEDDVRNSTDHKGIKYFKNIFNFKRRSSSSSSDSSIPTSDPPINKDFSVPNSLQSWLMKTLPEMETPTFKEVKTTQESIKTECQQNFFIKKFNTFTKLDDEDERYDYDTGMSNPEHYDKVQTAVGTSPYSLFEKSTTNQRNHKFKNIFRFHKSSTLNESDFTSIDQYPTETLMNKSKPTMIYNSQQTNEIFSEVKPSDQLCFNYPDNETFQDNKTFFTNKTTTQKSLMGNFRLNFKKFKKHTTATTEINQQSNGKLFPTESEHSGIFPDTDFTSERYTDEQKEIYLTSRRSVNKWLFKDRQKNRNSSSNCRLDYGKGNIFQWCSERKPELQRLNNKEVFISSEGSYYPSNFTFESLNIKQNETTPYSQSRNRFKDIFKFKSPSTVNITTQIADFTRIQHNVSISLGKSTETICNNNQTSPKSSTVKSTIKQYFSKLRKKIHLSKNSNEKKNTTVTNNFYDSFDEFQNPPVIKDNGTNNFEIGGNNISFIICNLTQDTNSSLLLHPDYVKCANLSNVNSEESHSAESAINITLPHNSSFHIMAYVMKPLENLISIFKATPNNVTKFDLNASEIQNGSLPDYLHPSNSSVVILAVNNTANTTKEVHEAKIGLFDVVKGWFHCVLESFNEPTVHDVHFYLYTRNNSVSPEELFLIDEPEPDNNTDVDFPEPVYEQESLSEMARRRRQYEEDYGFEYLSPAKSGLQSDWFNIHAETKVLIHGYIQDFHTDIMTDMKDAYLKKGDFNVIVVDWSVIGDSSCYPMVATKGLHSVGLLLAQLLDQLVEGGVSLSRVHLVGFSLGAHVAGHAGSELHNGLVYRITGLDPALPYVPMESKVSLDAGDAVFVDIIHSAAGYLGQPGPMGHVDFYPNGGSQQPGCDISSFGTCSHRRSALYFIESINSDAEFRASECESWQDFQAGLCNNTATLPMGENCPTNASGKYYLLTGQRQPFALVPEEHVKVKKSLLLDLFYDL
ncbi:hypothetical protein J6590_060009 [Homalodisca vitripennis]|nr:hypothetical protein J6590_060009 [Homalodisca vitripennis]